MDQNLKQRIVGTAVITSLAAIFVPMLFDNPVNDSGKFISELKLPDTPKLNTSNIYLEDLPNNVDDIISLPAPVAVTTNETEKNQKNVKTTQQFDTNHPRWFVQIGSFSQKENAISVQNKIRKQGFPVTISTLSTKKGLLHKVNAGPELDKIRAEKMKATIDRLNNIDSLLTKIEN